MKHRKIQIDFLKSQDLSTTMKEEMWAVYHPYYHYTKADFMERIQRNTAYAIYTFNQQIIGFTGLRIDQLRISGRNKLLIYFGQTVIASAHRGKSLIPRTGAKLLLKYWRALLQGEVYFWADALTYKAYLVFAKTVSEYYPNAATPTPVVVQSLLQFLGTRHYGADFSPHTGVVKKDRLLVNDPCITIPNKYRQDPDIRFFIAANPGYVNGYGLLTITPVSKRNCYLIMKRLFTSPKRKKKLISSTSPSVATMLRKPIRLIAMVLSI